MKKINRLMTSLLAGVTLASAAGFVGGSAVTAQAATKQTITRDVTVKTLKGLSKSSVVFKNVTAQVGGASVDVQVPKIKGYVANNGTYSFKAVKKNGKATIVPVDQPSYFDLHYYKVVSAASQKSSKAVKRTAHVLIYRNGLFAKTLKVKAVPGTTFTIKTPKLAGYKANMKRIRLGMNAKNAQYAVNNVTLPTYTKVKYGYQVSQLSASKTAKTLKVTGKVVTTKHAAKHAAKYVILTDYKGKSHAKLTKNGNFTKTLKNCKAAKKVSAVAAYRTKHVKNGKTTYTYHALSAKKSAVVKAAK
ncbi:hypothetical protein D1831_10260 [Lactiplantibacillus garii]|uniref:Cell surface protein n=1 Tax=Lactiplantibacillus garii TaxID=2306423 RepID=A0A3R8J5X2_9LACO|nr:hypothetical protein [Lactiplantibacillus garii]RRK09863.1 hypothetical protein D1831_10260 [Lactiplantibacillus garii]